MVKNSAFVLMLLGILVLAACSPSAPASPTAVPTDTVAPATPTTAATATSEPTAVPTTAPTAAASPTSASASATSVVTPTTGGGASAAEAGPIVTAMQTLAKTKSFRGLQTIESSQGSITSTIDVVMPDRFHITLAAFNTEVIMIGPDTYTRTAGGSWVKTASPTTVTETMTLLETPAQVSAFIATLSNVQSLGTETINGTPCNVYGFTQSISQAGVTGSSDVKLWVGVADGLPRQQVMKTTATQAGLTTEATITLVYSDFNSPDIKIEAPNIP